MTGAPPPRDPPPALLVFGCGLLAAVTGIALTGSLAAAASALRTIADWIAP